MYIRQSVCLARVRHEMVSKNMTESMRCNMKHTDEKDTYIGNATRNARKGKGRYDLISPRAMRRLARVFEDGAEGHGDRNWEQGILMSRFIDSALSLRWSSSESSTLVGFVVILADFFMQKFKY